MPVTARLSQRFYERFGDDLTNELVDWFNSVDTTYRSDLRDLNEANFARFDAKLEQRIASVHARIDGLEARIDARIDALEARVDARIGGIHKDVALELAAVEKRLIRWMFGFWTGSVLVLGGLLVALLH